MHKKLKMIPFARTELLVSVKKHLLINDNFSTQQADSEKWKLDSQSSNSGSSLSADGSKGEANGGGGGKDRKGKKKLTVIVEDNREKEKEEGGGGSEGHDAVPLPSSESKNEPSKERFIRSEFILI